MPIFLMPAACICWYRAATASKSLWAVLNTQGSTGGGDFDAGGTADQRHFGPLGEIDNGKGGGCGGGTDDGNDLILVDQFVYRGYGFGRISFGIIDHRLKHVSVNAAGGIDLFNHHLHGFLFRISKNEALPVTEKIPRFCKRLPPWPLIPEA